MSEHSTVNTSEKTLVKPKHLGLFARKKKVEGDDQSAHKEVKAAPLAEELRPVGFTELFRFSTKFELLIDFIGLWAAAAAGSGLPLGTLIFGKLTQQFVVFEQALVNSSAGSTQDEAAATFRRITAQDASYLVAIGAGMLLCTYTYMCIWVYTGEVNAKRIRERYLKAILRQNIAYFDNVGAGEVATRIQTDTHLVQQGISEKVALVVSFLSAFATGFIIAYTRNWRLALSLTSILPCIAITGGVMNSFLSRYKQLALEAIATGGSVAEEVISTVRTAHAFGTQPILSTIYDKHVHESQKQNLKAAVANGIGLGIFFFVLYASYGLAFSFGATLINRNEAHAGDVVTVFLAILIGSFSLALLAPDMQAISHGQAAAAKLFATIDRIPDIDSADPSGLKPETCRGEVTFEHVDFSYPSRPSVRVVRDLTIRFPAGRTAALVGASGSGKSTIVALIERFYDPVAGSVKLDGTELQDLNIKWLRSRIGLVSQEPVLFNTTIASNVSHGLTSTPWEDAPAHKKMELIKEACVKCNADGFISKLPNGYETVVGERGFLLSGGQKQRIAIARAIVSDPRILLLDEATSALDTQSEGIVQDALDKAAAGRTTITVAHRLSTIKDAAQIFVVGDGVVLEQGTHSELLFKEDSTYSRLVAAQQLREQREIVEIGSELDEGVPEDTAVRAGEVPLGRKDTGHSQGGEISSKWKQDAAHERGGDMDLSFPYLLKRIAMLNRDVWFNYAIGAVAAMLTGFVYPSYGIVFAKGINALSEVDPHQRRHDSDRTALWLFIIAILSCVTITTQTYMFDTAGAYLAGTLRSVTFRSVLRQDVEFFDKEDNTTGSLTSALSDNPQKVQGLAGTTLGAIVQSISTVTTGIIVGLIFAWKLGLVALACCPLLVSAGYIRLRIVLMKDQKNKRAHELSAQLACEAASSIRTVASLTLEDSCFELYSKSLEDPLKESNKTATYANLLFATSQSMSTLVMALVFWYGARLVSFQEFSTFEFFIALQSSVFSSVEAGNVFFFVPDMSSAKGAGSSIIKLVDTIPEIDSEAEEGVKISKCQGRIRFEGVHFRYPTRPGVSVLRNLDLVVDPGTYVALVGASGCGKSTAIQLIERFYDPLVGNIYLDNHNIAELNVASFRKQIALVSQEPTLYSGTVKFNVLLGAIKPHDEVTQEEIEAACRDANILEFIQSLPGGFDTEVGGKGSQLSGGQKQRIAIARALLRNPTVLLLDEATSALDSNSEMVVQTALDQAAKGRTTIAIAHRLSTIQNADRIYFMKEGRVSESGTHDQLLKRRGDYYEYVQLQGLSKT